MMDNTRIKEEQEKNEELNEEHTAASSQAGSEETPAAAENDELARLTEELAGARDKYLRLYSEFENFRRRTAREKLEMVQSANEHLIKSLLAVADDFHRAEKSLQEKKDQDTEGFLLIQNKFRKILETHGLQLMDVPRGSGFDTDRHEAISQVPAPEEGLKGRIIEVVENGYLLNDKVIRFAKVVVGG